MGQVRQGRLSDEGLKELDEYVDACISRLAVFKMPRAAAAVANLRYAEACASFAHSVTESPDDFIAATKNNQDALHFEQTWIHGRCNPGEETSWSWSRSHEGVLRELRRAAIGYSRVWDFMAILFRRWAEAERTSESELSIRYLERSALDVSATDRLIAMAADLEPVARDGLAELPVRAHGWIHDVRPRTVGARIRFDASEDVISDVRAYNAGLLRHLWELKAEWSLGPYTVAQLRDFWIGLKSMCFLRRLCSWSLGVPIRMPNAAVMITPRDRLLAELGRWTGLSMPVLQALIADHSFDSALHQDRRKTPDVTYQPIFPLQNDLLVVSDELVSVASGERNTWDLISVLRPELHERLRNEKEEVWISELLQKSIGLGLLAAERIPVKLGSNATDLDLLLVDLRDQFGLVVQLKWRTAPDRIAEVRYLDEELRRGVSQAVLARDWVRREPSRVSSRLGTTREALGGVTFEAIVLSKNSLGSGQVGTPEVPVFNDVLLRWVLGEPHSRSLRECWQVASGRHYLAVEGRHYATEADSAEIGGIRFVAPDQGMRVLRAWDPRSDIRFGAV